MFLCGWSAGGKPTEQELYRAATIVADRLCGSIANPIIRNAQERRQLAAIGDWLMNVGYKELPAGAGAKYDELQPGTYSFRLNVPVGQEGRSDTVNVSVDAAVMPKAAKAGGLPLLIEAKSAGDFTNVNKRRKEEATKMNQLRRTYGDRVRYVLFLCGYFDSGYLKYEAGEGIDWVWEHRIDDLGQFGLWMMKKAFAELEARRLILQQELDAKKDSPTRNRMGQFATPPDLAADILRHANAFLGQGAGVRFLDPAIGTGSFYSALLAVFPQASIKAAVGYEIDQHYGDPAAELWNGSGLDIRLEDFTQAQAPKAQEKFNLLICNPPYVRHHHMASGEKRRLKTQTHNACGMEVSGLAGLYCYFLGLSHAWMAQGGLAGWLIPSEFMDVNYGLSIKQYLLGKVSLLHIHRFDPVDVQFADALVSSTVVWFLNQAPRVGHEVRFTYGGTLERPRLERFVPVDTLRRDPKWTHYPMRKSHAPAEGPVLGDFFEIKRGLVTGNNSYFILSAENIARRGLPMEAFKPILPSPRYVPENEINGDRQGYPLLERRLFLLDPPWTEGQIKERHPKLWNYLEEGKAEGVADGYLCRHRPLWYSQERRPPAPFVCTYLGRSNNKGGRPFRFILNNSKATAANVYLMLYPKEPIKRALNDRPGLKRQIWEFLNAICPQAMLGQGRVYGGGLHKLEPKELGNVPAEAIAALLPKAPQPRPHKQDSLFEDLVA